MAARSRHSLFSVLLGLVLGILLASRVILPRVAELQRASWRRAGACAGGGGVRWAGCELRVTSCIKG
ncbi:hypothetical protein XELAEV_18011035mg [Xenopus laevis]|uniref:Uncharacterized protein n=1 Tax=Xenopus laevis TaxID=8355 RepID=A0A974DWI8_XENLA|nr:hypothetical protein XELAEV_18011035mg [Xenopus laevis]